MMEKQCSGCGVLKPLEEFRWKNKLKGQRISLCRECDKSYRAGRYATHKERIREICDIAVERRRELVARGAITEPDLRRCIDCCQLKNKEEFRWQDKSRLMRYSRCRECDQAYRADFYDENREQFIVSHRRAYQKLRQIIDEHKQGPCADCGKYFPTCAMDFDHRDPTTKIAKVSALAYKGSERLLLEEIAKCDLVCAVCHRIRTHKQSADSNSGSEESKLGKENDNGGKSATN
jgi:hypothetical protein